MSIENKELLTVKETAEIMGVTPAYVRQLLNNARYDKSIKINGIKIGKEWRISSNCIYKYLGIDSNEDNHSKEKYIKKLEEQIQAYKEQLSAYKRIIAALNEVVVSEK